MFTFSKVLGRVSSLDTGGDGGTPCVGVECSHERCSNMTSMYKVSSNMTSMYKVSFSSNKVQGNQTMYPICFLLYSVIEVRIVVKCCSLQKH